jgi:formyl-CoA transferase
MTTPGALSGTRVLELGTLIAGSFATRMLGDMGADVIKVEAPGKPDPAREWGHVRYRGRALWWPVLARNKRCVTLNLRETEGQDLFVAMAATADVVVENFKPGTLERWQLSYERLSEANRGLILARISGYGQTGPYAQRPGYASIAEALGGLRHMNGFPGRTPPRFGISLGDSLAAMFAVQGIQSALLWRGGAGGGQGQVVDVSLLESCLALTESAAPEYSLTGYVHGPQGTGLSGIAPSNTFRSSDGHDLIISANQDTLFERLCQAMGQPELSQDQRFSTHEARAENQELIESILADWAAQRPGAEIDEILNRAGVVCGPILGMDGVSEHPQVRAREALVAHSDPDLGEFLGPNVVPRLSDTPGGVRWSGPSQPGQHNGEVYGELGIDAVRLRDLEQGGIL